MGARSPEDMRFRTTQDAKLTEHRGYDGQVPSQPGRGQTHRRGEHSC